MKKNIEYEEATLMCEGCGKKLKSIVLKKRNIKTFLCQRCAKNEVQ